MERINHISQGYRFNSSGIAVAFCLILLSFFLCFQAFAQEPVTAPTESPLLQEKLEQHAESLEEESDYTDLFAELEYLVSNPVKINFAGADELKQLFFLNEIQINNLLDYIAKYGALITAYELAYIDGFDRETIALLIPYISFSKEAKTSIPEPRQFLKYGKNQVFVRYQQLLETQKGFLPVEDSMLQANPNLRYPGSSYRLYTRYAFNHRNRIRWGITAEKDPGEEFFKGSQKAGFDFYSAFVYMKGDKWLRDIVIGDYHLQFGQGLTLWTTPSFGKTSDVTAIRKISRGVRPSTSVNENQFMRGGAATFGYKRFTITAFGSHKKVDATIKDADSATGEVLTVSALQISGLHRTTTELKNRKALGETVFGGRAALTGTRYQVGATFYRMELAARLEPTNQLYNTYYFRGNSNQVAGIDFLYLFRKAQVFGEVARSHSGGTAFIAGGSFFPATRLALSAIYRRYHKNFHNLYQGAFAESSSAMGEQGLFVGILFLVSPKVTFSGYTDHYRFNWLRFRVDAPSMGREYLGEIAYRITRSTELRIRYRFKQRDGNISTNDLLTKIEPLERQNFRIHLQYQPFATISLRNRIEWTWNTINGSDKKQGYMMYQDVIWKPVQQWAFTARYAVFDTDTYDERIYAYENDVLYAFSVPSYYYKGSRAYLLLRWQASRNIDCWVKASQTWYANTTLIGSGLDEIGGDTRSEIKVQVRFKF